MTAGPAPYVLYEGHIGSLTVEAFGVTLDVSDILSNGRSSYILFQKLVGLAVGLDSNSEGGDSDLAGPDGKYEVKAFPDLELHPKERDLFHTAASSTFSANNQGPEVKRLLDAGCYADALALCKESGFDKNDFYVYTNTSKYSTTVPLRFIVLPKTRVLELLSTTDPRLISRREVLGEARETRLLDLSV